MRFGMAGGALLTLGESRPRLGESVFFFWKSWNLLAKG